MNIEISLAIFAALALYRIVSPGLDRLASFIWGNPREAVLKQVSCYMSQEQIQNRSSRCSRGTG